jgi:uncharacterized protein (DUF58 family)
VNASATVSRGRTAPGQFIDPAVLARIDNLDLVSRLVVDGFISGLHKAVYLGVSPDFAGYRPYTPGDDIRRVDWRVFARTDRLYMKTSEAETNADVVFVLDISRSMDFTSHEVTKLDYGRFLIAALVHLAGRQRDRVGFAAFDSELCEFIPASARRRDQILQTLGRVKAARSGHLEVMGQLAERLRRRGIVVVVSDFYADTDEVTRALDALRLRGHDVSAFHLLDPLEQDLVLDEPTVLRDLETGAQVPVSPSQRKDYRDKVSAHVAALTKACGERQLDYTCLPTDQPLDAVLMRYLSDRARLARVR